MAEPKTVHEVKLLQAFQRRSVKSNTLNKYLSLHPIKLDDERYFDNRLIIVALKEHEVGIARLLIEQGFRVHKGSQSIQEKTVLHAAFGIHQIQTRTDFINTLLAKGAAIDILTLNEENKSPFHLAIDKHLMSIIELFLSQLDVKAFDDKHVLHYAIEKNNVKVVLKLIAKGCSLKKKNEKNSTPFCVALKNGRFKILDILLSHFNVKCIDLNNSDDLSQVYIASIRGRLKIIKKYANSSLCINVPVKLSADTWSCLRDYSEFTLLHLAVKYVKLDVIKFLLGRGADFFVQNKNGLSPLHIAFENKEIGLWKTWKKFNDNNIIIDLILKANIKFNSNPINKNGLSHFHIACSRDEPTVVEHFLKLNFPINQAVKSNYHLFKGFSPLHFAAKFRCKNTMEVLLKNGADVKQTDFNGMTALHVAAEEFCLDTVNLLLEYGANVTSRDSHGKTPIHWAFENRNHEAVDLLLSVPNVTHSNLINKEGISHFHIACTRNNLNIVKSFIENGVLINACVPSKPDTDENSILNVDVDVDDADWSGYSPLHFAVTHNRSNIVHLLVCKGANIGIKDNRGFTPLHMACNYSYEIFDEFIETTLRDLNKHGKLAFQFRPLTDVAKVYEKCSHGFSGSIEKMNWSSNRKEHMKIINSLLSSGSDVNCTDNNGNTPVFHACVSIAEIGIILKNNLQCSEPLSDQIIEDLSLELYERRKLILNELTKLDVNLDKCYKNSSILHYICSTEDSDSEEMMKLLLKKGTNVDAVNEGILTPLHLATLNGRIELISMLLHYGANVDCIFPEDNSTPLLIASELDPYSYNISLIIKILVDGGANINAKQTNGMTALHNLVLHSENPCVIPAIATLIEAGADINNRGSYGFTALHLACLTENVHVLEELLVCGADVNVKNDKGKTVCCYLYEKYLENRVFLRENVRMMRSLLQKHVFKMSFINLPLSGKTLLSYCKFGHTSTDPENQCLVDEMQNELTAFKATKIHANCTLYDVIFKNENSLSRIIGNPRYEDIVKAESFGAEYPHFGYLIRLKYRAGVDRANILPEAKQLLNDLFALRLPDMCSENICKYFKNVELRESVEILRGVLDLKMKKSDDMRLRRRTLYKRQKVN